MRTAIIFLLAVGAVLGAGEALPGQAPGHTGAATVKALGRLPLYFVENRGVYPDEVRYYIQGADKTLFFTDSGVTIALKGKERGWTVKLDFAGANPDARPEGLDKQRAVFSYFRGSEKDWKAGLPTFAKLVYRNLWPGIDLVYNGTVNQLKYEFRVAPGADPKQIRLRYRGASEVAATEAGALRVATPEGSFEDAPPFAWQEIDGERVPVEMAYTLAEGGRFGFTVGNYDCTRPLVLDPAVIVYCGYIGGSGGENARGVAVDSAGNAYVVGDTDSTEKQRFPVTVGPDLTFNSSTATTPRDVYVAKIDPSGKSLVYCGYIGGDNLDTGTAIAVDRFGCAYVCGRSHSSQASFPVTKGPFTKQVSAPDAFVAKVDPAGKSLLYCGYLGGSQIDEALGIAIDGKGAAYVAGRTVSSQSQGFPVKTGPDLTYNGNWDVFVAKIPPSGVGVEYCGYIGGSNRESWSDTDVGIAVDSAGNAYVTGSTGSDQRSFPVKVGPDLTLGGLDDAFIAKVDASGKHLVYCGYIGGSALETTANYSVGRGIAVDRSGNAYVTGSTRSTAAQGFPVKNGPATKLTGGLDAFVAKIDPTGKTFVYSGYIGGTGLEDAEGIVVDRNGSAYIVGTTSSTDLPVRNGPDATPNGANDAYVAKVSPIGQLIQCGYVGGSALDAGLDIARDAAGCIYIVGSTRSDQKSFPVRTGPDATFNGGVGLWPQDAFVAKIGFLDDLTASGTPRPGATVTMHLAAIEARGLTYQIGASFGTGPIKVDTRTIGLSVDGLLEISVGGKWPHVFQGYSGMLDGQGKATAKIVIPSISALVGQKLYSAFVTLDPSWPSGIRSISETRVITIVK